MPLDGDQLPDQEKCAEILREQRWGEEVRCARCTSGTVVRNGVRKDGVQQYRCKSCETSFNDRTGTVFSSTRMRLEECFYILESLEEDESVNSISQDLGRSWKTVNDFIRRLEQGIELEEITQQIRSRVDTGLDVDYARLGCG